MSTSTDVAVERPRDLRTRPTPPPGRLAVWSPTTFVAVATLAIGVSGLRGATTRPTSSAPCCGSVLARRCGTTSGTRATRRRPTACWRRPSWRGSGRSPSSPSGRSWRRTASRASPSICCRRRRRRRQSVRCGRARQRDRRAGAVRPRARACAPRCPGVVAGVDRHRSRGRRTARADQPCCGRVPRHRGNVRRPRRCAARSSVADRTIVFQAVSIAVATSAPLVVTSALFGESGRFPFPGGSSSSRCSRSRWSRWRSRTARSASPRRRGRNRGRGVPRPQPDGRQLRAPRPDRRRPARRDRSAVAPQGPAHPRRAVHRRRPRLKPAARRRCRHRPAW